MYKCINNWTKKKMIQHIKTNFKGKSMARLSHLSDRESCVYRGKNGAKCAVGMFIPDVLYKKSFEGTCASKIIEDVPKLQKLIPLAPDLMELLQQEHDDSEDDESCLVSMLNWIKDNVKE